MHRKLKIRSMVIGLFFTLLFLGLVSRMYYVQIVEASMLLEKAERLWADEDILPAKRGSILDRKGKVFAEDGVAFTVAVNPKIIADKGKDIPNFANEISQGLALILGPNAGVDTSKLEKQIYAMTTKLKQNGKDLAIEVEVNPEGWKIDGEIKLKIDELAISIREKYDLKKNSNIGLYTKEVIKRYYPLNSLASQVLGYVNKAGDPVGGIESSLDEILKGLPGKLNHEKDTSGVEIPDSKVSYTPAVMGNNVRLTIDQNIQYYTETAIQKAMDLYHPKSMTAIVVNPKTMEILAMANAPTFNPNRYWEAEQQDYKNLSISDAHEPGSTFKLVTLAGAVQENLFNPNDTYQSGSIRVPGSRPLHDHNYVGWGPITYMRGLLYSSNVAFVKLGYEKLGVDRLKAYINNFGFGSKTNIDLPNEVAGTIGQMKYDSEQATATYGQGQVVVTAIQQIAAYAAIANGGKLMWPHVVKDIEDSKTNEIIKKFEPKIIKQAVTAATAKQTSLYLEQVVADQEYGTGKKAYMNGYRIAGKTGTASVVDPGKNTYKTDSWLISFIGYAPVEDPQILIAIIADEPDLGGDYHQGSFVWAPVFRDIMTPSLRNMGITSNTVDAKTVSETPIKTIPDLSQTTLTAAKNLLNQTGLTPEVFGNGAKIIKQFPLAGTEISMSRPVYVTTEAKITTVPDFTGKSLRDSIEICALLDLQCKVSGEGYVTKQVVTGTGAQRSVKFELHPLSEPTPEVNEDSVESQDASPNASPEETTESD
ncbi:PASTA domain-containing protein [Paenibacillus psychroresistens]|uniref:PASTA domain-containing protein n=1 Tax=Paenibacillus psychroresistens TaxID=1778678 RepID=A0A6B8RJL4_9BACL|nr:penicillin-binding transpeptidase domain-containing protein [Paenibacillus psychroresistens]QGQ95772.1 PASTA domain-containing protein [Paenibacillus psychroresistens]